MHLILAQKGQINEGNEAVDLGQSPGDILVLSAADTEIASLAAAQHGLGGEVASLRLANLMQLAHPMSVDTYADRTAAHARLIVVRVLGGAGYWPYGLEKLYTLAVEHDIAMAVLPGDDKADPALSQYCTVAPNHCQMLHQYLVQGGPQNSANFLRYCHWLMGAAADEPEAPSPLLKAGLWYPGKGICHPSDLPGAWVSDRPVVAICFYRALVQSGGLEPIAALVDALGNEGMNALPVFVSSFKDAVSVETVRGLFGELWVLRQLLNYTGDASETVSAWCGPDKVHQDFIFRDTAIETKTLSGRERNSVRISSEDQLETLSDRLYLSVLRLVTTSEPSSHAFSLNELVHIVENELAVAMALDEFYRKISSIGYFELPDYDEPFFIVANQQFYHVKEDFPRLARSELPDGITRVSYNIRLETIESYKCSEQEVWR